jgi:general secretion pathway protein M
MADWFQQLAPRERMIVSIGGLLVVLIIGWRFVWAPLQARSAELEQQVGELTRLLVDVQRAASLGGADAPQRYAAGSTELITLVSQTAGSLGLSLERTSLEQDGNAMNVSFRNAPFDVLNAWLTQLELEHGVTVAQVSSISSAGTPGLVNGQILISRSAI